MMADKIPSGRSACGGWALDATRRLMRFPVVEVLVEDGLLMSHGGL